MDTNIRRRFTGKLSGFESRIESNFHKKALKAYRKGWERFKFGRDGMGKPLWYDTPQIVEFVGIIKK